jgi:hypothetical protein
MDTILLQVQDLAIKRVAPTDTLDPDFLTLIPAIYRFLKAWAQAIPQEKLDLIGPRLYKIKSVLEEHTFEIQYIWSSPPIPPELCIQYKNHKDIPLLNVSLTPKLLLFKDLETSHKEIAFPSTWSA